LLGFHVVPLRRHVSERRPERGTIWKVTHGGKQISLFCPLVNANLPMAISRLSLVYLAHLKISLPFLKKGRGLFRNRKACAPPLGAVPLPFRNKMYDAFLSPCGHVRMPRNRPETPRRAFGDALAARWTVSRVAALESNRSNDMILDALGLAYG
ncbi:MAG: hypothetical protein ACK55Z_13640, partial [bacterium]